MDIDLSQRVRNGITWLDAYGPKNWRRKIAAAIKARRFDMASAKHCALGEIYGDYSDAIDNLDIDNPLQLGFDKDCSRAESYADVTAEWKRRYREGQRQAAKAKRG